MNFRPFDIFLPNQPPAIVTMVPGCLHLHRGRNFASRRQASQFTLPFVDIPRQFIILGLERAHCLLNMPIACIEFLDGSRQRNAQGFKFVESSVPEDGGVADDCNLHGGNFPVQSGVLCCYVALGGSFFAGRCQYVERRRRRMYGQIAAQLVEDIRHLAYAFFELFILRMQRGVLISKLLYAGGQRRQRDERARLFDSHVLRQFRRNRA